MLLETTGADRAWLSNIPLLPRKNNNTPRRARRTTRTRQMPQVLSVSSIAIPRMTSATISSPSSPSVSTRTRRLQHERRQHRNTLPAAPPLDATPLAITPPSETLESLSLSVSTMLFVGLGSTSSLSTAVCVAAWHNASPE